MHKLILSLIASVVMIVIGIYLSQNTNRLFYGLILGGVLYGSYEIYLIATYKHRTQKQQESRRKLAEQNTFRNEPPSGDTKEPTEVSGNSKPSAAGGNPEFATIIVNWYKEKMGLGSLPVYVNGVDVGVIKKGNLKVMYRTSVPFNIIGMGVYKVEIDLSPGDTVEYFVAGNGIRHDRTIITKHAK